MTRPRGVLWWVARSAAALIIVAGPLLSVPWLDGKGHLAARLAGAGAALVVGLIAVVISTIRPPSAVDRRRTAYLRTLGGVLAVLLIVGLMYRVDHGPARLLGSPGGAAVGILVVAGFATALGEALLVASRVLDRWRRRGPRLRIRRSIPFWVALVALAVLWTPALVALAPGSVTYDGQRQMDELFGVRIPSVDFTYTPTNHHPWFATVWQGTLLKAGMALSHGSIDGGLLLHCVVLVALSLLTYAAVVHTVQRLAGPGWAIVALVFFGVLPHFANYAMLYEKTGWYQLALTWFMLGVVGIVLRIARLRWAVVMIAGGGLLASLFRSNGVLIVVGALVVVLVAELVRRRPRGALAVGGSLVAIVAIFAGWSLIALPRLGVEPASPGEALVIPFQQVARIVVEHGDELTPAQRVAINEVMPVDRIPASYNPTNGDGIKGLYEVDTFLVTDEGIAKAKADPDWWRGDAYRRHLVTFAGVWAQLVLEHPLTALSATVDNTYIYYTPSLDRGDDISLFDGGLTDFPLLANRYVGDYHHLAGESPATALSRYYLAWARAPGLELLSNPGIYGWTVVALGLSLLFWRRRHRLLLWIPPALVYVINFAGARNGDFRYTVALLPLLVLCLAGWWTRPASAAAGDAVERHVAVAEHELEAGG